ncbi:MAG: SCO family protein [Phaeovulum sp.]|uniref:SCO family protein n=1 Tax=Phaeovulum sp. TaxID=2934796 RepID=UPI002733A6B5|nr:SCO family protein [Phaeovulum sp.]MDP3862810.1 SCO family protein [Phaeovulum sp.]
MSVSTRTYAIGAVTIAAVALGATWWATQRVSGDVFAKCRQGAIAGGIEAIGGPFTLTDENGRLVTEKDIITGPTLLYFGYTFCPDVCPLDNARNAEAIYQLDDRGYEVTPVFVSVDYIRDTPENQKEFTDVMHPRMIGLVGTKEQVEAASRAYRTYFKMKEPENNPYFLIDHSTQSYLSFPEPVGFVEYFNRDVAPEAMADRIACFVDVWKTLK